MAKNNASQKPQTFKRKPIPDAEKEKYLEDFKKAIENQSDLVCALVTAAYLEGALITLLSSFFVKCGTSEDIFKFTLSDFAKCAQMARCLGFINSTMMSNLTTIAHIRNLFAHERKSLKFEDEEIKLHCDDLKLPKVIQEAIDAGDKKAQRHETDPSLRFRTVSGELLVWLAILADDADKKPVDKYVRHNFEHLW